MKKAKEKILGGGNKPKKEDKLLKDIDSPAKLLANLDAAYVCAHAASKLEVEGNTLEKFDAQDPYNKKPLINLFTRLVNEIKPDLYEKVLDFNESKRDVEISIIEKDIEQLDKDIDNFTLKTSDKCIEEIKRNVLEDDLNKPPAMKETEIAKDIVKEMSLDEIQAKEKAIEEDIERLLNGKIKNRGILTEHDNKLKYLEESFNKIEMGSKAWTLLLKGLKDEATEIEFDLNENTKALTRNAEAIPEKIGFAEKYKQIFVKRKPLK